MADTEKNAETTIACVKNGPYSVKQLERLRNSRGEEIPHRDSMILCRCGASATKPFCDGAHRKVGFNDEKSDQRVGDKRDNYVGRRITIHDNRGICSHAAYCTDLVPEVWRSGIEPWIDPDAGDVERIIEIIEKCPSGALSYTLDGAEHRDLEQPMAVEVMKDGPLMVQGGIPMADTEFGEGGSQEHYALCRCGASKNKPFCDGSHWYANFADEEAMYAPPAEEPEQTWVRVAANDDLSVGQVKAVQAGGKSIALIRLEDGHKALDGRCPHQGGPLAEGILSGGCLQCPWHGWGFDPATGQADDPAHDNVASYPVEEREDGVYVSIESESGRSLTISDVMAQTMVNWGVKVVFGMVGHSNLGLADALRRQAEMERITYIGVRHEGAAAFACSAYAKLTGRPAACLAIAGPGATNLLTGLWDCHVDRAPVLALTGQVNTQFMGPGAFQEIDLASAYEAVSAWSQTVLPNSNHAELMTQALKHAVVQRGVAHLIFPDEVQNITVDDGALPSSARGRLGGPAIAPDEDSLNLALYRIGYAKRPTIIVGHGAREGMAQVIALAEALNAPVLTTFKAKGQIGDDHPLAAGVLGRSGTPIAANTMSGADLLIVFGASFSQHTGIDADKPIIQVDDDRLALGKFHPVSDPLWGEVARTADLLREKLPEWAAPEDRREEIARLWADWRQEKRRRAEQDAGHGLNSAVIMDALTRHAPADAVIAVDVGNNTYSFGRYFECKRQSVLMSGYLGSIGFAFPAAMGAWAANTGRPIISVCGDGGFGQYLAEFNTAVKYDMNITNVLLNNGELGKISKEQRAGAWPVWQTSLHNPNFAEYAQLCGGHGVRVTRPDELDQALEKAIAHPGPALVEIISDAELI